MIVSIHLSASFTLFKFGIDTGFSRKTFGGQSLTTFSLEWVIGFDILG